MEEIRPTHARRPDFEFDFGFFLFWLDDFRRVVEWATRCNGWRISVFFFFFFFWFYFRRLDCCCFGVLNFFPILGFCIFGLMGSNPAIG
jgi:hypothetical protein